MIDVAVTDAPNAPPIPNVPPAYVAEDQPAKWVTATDPPVANVNALEFVLDELDAAFQVHA